MFWTELLTGFSPPSYDVLNKSFLESLAEPIPYKMEAEFILLTAARNLFLL